MTNNCPGLTRNGSFIFLSGIVFLSLCLLMAMPPAAQAGPGDQDGPAIGIISNWHLDETSSGAYVDSYNANYYNIKPNGSFHGEYDGICAQAGGKTCPTPEPIGMLNRAQVFNGTTSGIDIPIPDPTLNMFNWPADDSFTVEFWMKRDGVCPSGEGSGANEVVVGRHNISPNHHWWVGVVCNQSEGPDKIKFNLNQIGGGPAVFSSITITDTDWHHIVAVRNAVDKENYIYIDGNLEGSEPYTSSSNLDYGSEELNIGWLNLLDGYHFQGSLDEIAIYNRALSAEEVATHYNNGSGLFTKPIQILPAGDSITKGSGTCQSLDGTDPYLNCIGYRSPLWYMLTEAGYFVNFVGDQGGYYQYQYIHDNNHLGYGGWTDSGIAGIILDRLETFNPDVMLLHIGTNSPNEDPNQVKDILDIVDRYEFGPPKRSVTVILAKIIKKLDTNRQPMSVITNFNNNIEAMATARINGTDGGTPNPSGGWYRAPGVNDNIHIVDMESAVPEDNIPDRTHPDADGYYIMAGVWFDKLIEILPLTSDTSPPSTPTGLAAVAQSDSSISLSWNAATDPESNIASYNIFRNNTFIGNSIDTSFVDEGLTASTSYTYKVSAVNSAGLEGSRTAGVTESTPADTIDPAIDSVSTPGPASVIVTFSEPVEQASAETESNYTLDDGSAAITNENPADAELAGDGKSVLLTFSTEMSPGVTYNLAITNVVDLASRPVNSNTDFEYQGPGNRVTDGLIALYDFIQQGGDTDTVFDVSGEGSPLNLTVADEANVTWLTDRGLAITEPTIIASAIPAAKIINACTASNELTIEAWISPADTDVDPDYDPARIVTLSTNSAEHNFMLGQRTDQYIARLQTGIPELRASMTLGLKHVVFTRDSAGNRNIYIDNVPVASDTIAGDFSTWDTTGAGFALGNEFGAPRPWLGEYHLVAVYDKALSIEEIQTNFDAGPSGTSTATNQAPSADAGPDIVVADEDLSGSESVTLNASGCYDTDGIIMTYAWTDNNSLNETGINPVVNLTVGSHTITLTVTDDQGATDTDVCVITVTGPPPPDDDGDGVPDDQDNCPNDPNTNQADFDGDDIGDVCDSDADGDDVLDTIDNCLFLWNNDQSDNDSDNMGDPCDDDDDNDGAPDTCELQFDCLDPLVDEIDYDPDADGRETPQECDEHTDPCVWDEAPQCPADLVHYWKLDETSGSTFVDFAGTSDATYSETPLTLGYVAGQVDGAIDFDGTDDRLSADLTSPSSGLTLMAWIYPETGSLAVHDRGIISKEGSFILEVESDSPSGGLHELSFSIFNPTLDEFEPEEDFIPEGVWTHVAATYDSATKERHIYINGLPRASKDSVHSAIGNNPATPAYIGYSFFNPLETRFFDGIIDEVAIFSRPLTALEISDIYQDGLDQIGYCVGTPPTTGTITIVKDAVPDDSQAFAFTGDLGAFSLSDGGTDPDSETFGGLDPAAGPFAVTEAAVAGWSLDSISCDDPDVTVDLGTGTVTIDLAAGEHITCTFTNSQPTTTDCPTGMVAYWRLDENDTTFVDYVGDLDLTCTGNECPVYEDVDGKVDQCQDFDGSNDILSSPVTSNPTDQITVMAWIRPSDLSQNGPDECIISKDLVFELTVEEDGNEISWVVLQNGIDNSVYSEHEPSVAIQEGVWTHIAATFNAGTQIVYINGVPAGTPKSAGFTALPNVNNAYDIGYVNMWGPRSFNGLIDEVAVFETALSQSDIQTLYNKGVGGEPYCEDIIPTPDIDGSGAVDGKDLALFIGAYDAQQGVHDEYDPLCDFDQDGYINETDLGTFSGEFGEVY